MSDQTSLPRVAIPGVRPRSVRGPSTCAELLQSAQLLPRNRLNLFIVYTPQHSTTTDTTTLHNTRHQTLHNTRHHNTPQHTTTPDIRHSTTPDISIQTVEMWRRNNTATVKTSQSSSAHTAGNPHPIDCKVVTSLRWPVARPCTDLMLIHNFHYLLSDSL